MKNTEQPYTFANGIILYRGMQVGPFPECWDHPEGRQYLTTLMNSCRGHGVTEAQDDLLGYFPRRKLQGGKLVEVATDGKVDTLVQTRAGSQVVGKYREFPVDARGDMLPRTVGPMIPKGDTRDGFVSRLPDVGGGPFEVTEAEYHDPYDAPGDHDGRGAAR